MAKNSGASAPFVGPPREKDAFAAANATPEALDLHESPAGLAMSVPAGGDPARGSGWGRIQVTKRACGFEITYCRDLWTWETACADQPVATLTLPGLPAAQAPPPSAAVTVPA